MYRLGGTLPKDARLKRPFLEGEAKPRVSSGHPGQWQPKADG